ncbi:hypothetical protein Arth_0985 [Arthrobacter sp. FB24]|nr:hypothetical protein Arth_0985 [Arthrobacter sp. FB24]
MAVEEFSAFVDGLDEFLEATVGSWECPACEKGQVPAELVGDLKWVFPDCAVSKTSKERRSRPRGSRECPRISFPTWGGVMWKTTCSGSSAYR